MGHIFSGSIILVLNILCINSAKALTLVNVKTGKVFASEERLQAGKILVFTEDGCSACAAYSKALSQCSENIKDRVEFISISSAAKTKQMIKRQKLLGPVYVVDSLQGSGVRGTPTTLIGNFSQLGALSCALLESQVSTNN